MTDERATERLVRAREHTDDRGRATAEVVAEPYADGDTLHVPIEVLTTGERHALSFRLPETWDEATPGRPARRVGRLRSRRARHARRRAVSRRTRR